MAGADRVADRRLAAGPAGDTTCAITTGGALHCWGFNGSGQVGDGTTMNQTTPVAVPSLPVTVKPPVAATVTSLIVAVLPTVTAAAVS